MKVSLLCSATLFTLATFAFPANLLNNDLSDVALSEITELAAKIKQQALSKRQLGTAILPPGFDADAQRVSTIGQWKYVRRSLEIEAFDMFGANHPVRRLRRVRMTSVGLALV